MFSLGLEYNFNEPYKWLREYINANRDQYKEFSCRGAVVGEGESSKIVIAVVEAIPMCSLEKAENKKHVYKNVTLFKEIWDYDKIISELDHLESGLTPWGEFEFNPAIDQQWEKDKLTLKNNHMESAGHLLSVRFPDSGNITNNVLVEPGLPYYPNMDEALKSWMELPIYHGSSDGRNGELIFLFPEVRAYFSDIEVEGDRVDIQVDGTIINKVCLLVNGAWWDKGGIHHFEHKVVSGKVRLNIPSHVQRVEYVLIDDLGVLYDYQYEDERGHAGLGRCTQNSEETVLVEFVKDAINHGEGEAVEYKPFVVPLNKKKGGKLCGSKFYEILKTVSAFSNNKGGSVFIGVSDECAITGIDQELAKWADAKPDNEAINKYLTAIKSGIRDHIIGAYGLDIVVTFIDSQTIVIINVKADPEKTTHIRDEKVLYYRRGSNNIKLRPDEWSNLIRNSKSDVFNVFN